MVMVKPMEDEKQKSVNEAHAADEIPAWENTGSGYDEIRELPETESDAAADQKTRRAKRIEKIKDAFWFTLFALMMLYGLVSKFRS